MPAHPKGLCLLKRQEIGRCSLCACEKLPRDTLIDGEVIAVADNGRVLFNALQHSQPREHIQFYAFDILLYRGRSTIRIPLEERRKLLRVALHKVQYPVLRSTPFDGSSDNHLSRMGVHHASIA